MPQTLKRSAVTGLLTGISGFLLMIGLITANCSGAMTNCMASGDEVLFPVFVGAAIGGMVFFWFFGQAGRRGWLLAAVGAVLATALGAQLGLILAGILQEGFGVFSNAEVFIAGPLLLVFAFDQEPVSMLFWAASMIITHLILCKIFLQHTKA